MKTLKFLMSVSAFAFAIAAAFAFKPVSPITAGYVNSSNQCRQASAVCSGNSQDCRVDIPEVPGTALILIKDFDSGCATTLKMD